jgi:hypothetical protein
MHPPNVAGMAVPLNALTARPIIASEPALPAACGPELLPAVVKDALASLDDHPM